MPVRSVKTKAADPELPITRAITELREGYNTSDVERVLSVFADEFTDMSDGEPSWFGVAAKQKLRERLEALFQRHKVTLEPTIIKIRFSGDTAWDTGWHEFTLEPRSGGPKVTRRFRYLEHWQRATDGRWRISMFLNNGDRPPQM